MVIFSRSTWTNTHDLIMLWTSLHQGRCMVHTIATWAVLKHSLLVSKYAFKCPCHIWTFMALDNDISSTRPMTYGLVTNIIGHEKSCIICDIATCTTKWTCQPCLNTYLRHMGCIQVVYIIIIKKMTLYIGPMSPYSISFVCANAIITQT